MLININRKKVYLIKLGLLIATVPVINGCASTRPTTTIKEAYGIYDIKPGNVSRSKIEGAIIYALKANTDHVKIENKIPPHPLPEKPGRFKLNNFMGALGASMGGISIPKIPACEDSVLMATATLGGIGEKTRYYACLFPYQGGFHLNTYASFTEKSGSIDPFDLGVSIGKKIGKSMMGGEPVPRTTHDIMEGLKKTGVSITQVEAYP